MVRTSRLGLSANMLKLMAICLMFADHMVTAFLPWGSVEAGILHIPGRLVAPIMCYLMAEGFAHTSNLRRYVLRVLCFAALAHFPYVWLFRLSPWHTTSVMWGLALGLVALYLAGNEALPVWARFGGVGLCCLAAIPADWGYVSVLWIVCFGFFRSSFTTQMACFAAVGILCNALPTVLRCGWAFGYQFAVVLAIPFLALYTGQRGASLPGGRWGFYLFYPAHMLFLLLLRMVL